MLVPNEIPYFDPTNPTFNTIKDIIPGNFSLTPMALRFLNREKTLKAYYTYENDVIEFMRAEPDLQYRYYFQATQELEPEYDLL